MIPVECYAIQAGCLDSLPSCIVPYTILLVQGTSNLHQAFSRYFNSDGWNVFLWSACNLVWQEINHTIETQLCGQKLITIYFYNARHPVVLFISEEYHSFIYFLFYLKLVWIDML